MSYPDHHRTEGQQGGNPPAPGPQPRKDMDRDRGDQEPSTQAGRPSPIGTPSEGHGNTEHSGQPASRRSGEDEEVDSMPSTKRHVPGEPDEDTRNPG